MILSRVTQFSLRPLTRQMLRAAALLVLVLSTTISQAQQTPEMVFQPVPGSSSAQASASASGFPESHISGPPSPEEAGVGGLGLLGRVGHIAGETIERNQSITYFDLSPYMFVEDTYLFGDGRLFLTNQGHMGGSAGLGIRQYFPRNDFVLGASAWYDRDDSRNAYFEQLGMSFELFSQWMDIRSNYYTAIGNNKKSLGTTIAPGSAAFTDHNITFSTQTALSTGADMVDLMFTVPVPGEVAQSMNLEASAGWYRAFTPSLGLKNINGYKLRMDADFLDRVLHVYTELTQDSFFDTNLVVAADVNYWHHLEARPRFGSSQFNRIAQWVRRNRNVVTIDSNVVNSAQAAINPNTGLAYYVNHVRNVPGGVPLPNFPAPAGTGALLTPFQFIDEAQTALPNADLIFVHADSVYVNRPLVMNDGELILGEGVGQSIPVQGLSQPLQLPRATSGASRPLFQNTVGTAVTLADNNLFAGFDITNTTGTAIFGNTINAGVVRDVRINGTTGAAAHGVHLQNSAGTINLQSVNISNTAGNAFYVDGGSAAVVYGSGTITNTTGYAVLIENNSGSVNMAGSVTTDIGGNGVRIFNSSAATTLGDLTLTNSTGPAIEILNVTGGVSLFANALITNPTGDGLLIQNLSGSVAALDTITINTRNAVGINLLDINAGATVTFADTVTLGAPAVGPDTGEHGINYQSSDGLVSFQNITMDTSNGAGINIGGPLPANTNSSTAQFLVTGTTSISNAFESSIRLLNDNSRVVFNGINISTRRNHGIEIFNHSGTTNFASLTTISNANNNGNAAVDIQQSTGSIVFGTVVASNTRGTDAGVQILDNTGSVNFTSLSVESILTTALDIENNTSISIAGGTLDATGGRAITMIDNTAFSTVFDAVSSTVSDFGIFVSNDIALFDHPGIFRVLGDGQTGASGGTITTQTVAGASLFNVETVDLRFIDFLSNQVGVTTNDVHNMTLFGDQISGSTSFGLDVLDNANLLIQQNIFDSNAGFNQARIQASQVRNASILPAQTIPQYSVIIRDNIFTDDVTAANVGLGDMIAISTQATANNSTLNLLVENNGRTFSGGFIGFSSNRGFGDAAISTVWNGNVTATYQGNNIRMSALAGQVGTRLISNRSSALNDVVYTGNVLNDGGGNLDVGLNFDFSGTANVSINNNFGLDANGNQVVDGFLMDGNASAGDRALDLVFRSTNNAIDISRNRITFNSFDGTAILFETISGPSTVNMDGNRIVMFDDALLPNELGIVFQTVVGNITLSSIANQDNVILPSGLFTTQPLTIPGGVSTGSFLINGNRIP